MLALDRLESALRVNALEDAYAAALSVVESQHDIEGDRIERALAQAQAGVRLLSERYHTADERQWWVELQSVLEDALSWRLAQRRAHTLRRPTTCRGWAPTICSWSRSRASH
jgi:hypothetical protein